MNEVDNQTLNEWKIRHLKKKGVVDPNVDLFMGVFDDKVEVVKAALDAGADTSITDTQVIHQHAFDLVDFDPKDWQA
jgi:hypothetical protein